MQAHEDAIWTPPAHSTLHIRTPLTMGIDPGKSWTGICIRLGNQVLWGATIGHRGESPQGMDNQMDAWMDYVGLICDWTVKGWQAVAPEGDPIEVVAEHMVSPNPFLKGARADRAKLNYTACQMIVAGLRGRWDNLIVIPPQGFSDAHQVGKGGTGNPYEYYPLVIIGRRGHTVWPEHWGPNHMPRREFRNVQSAFAVAGAGVVDRSEIIHMRRVMNPDGSTRFIEHERAA